MWVVQKESPPFKVVQHSVFPATQHDGSIYVGRTMAWDDKKKRQAMRAAMCWWFLNVGVLSFQSVLLWWTISERRHQHNAGAHSLIYRASLGLHHLANAWREICVVLRQIRWVWGFPFNTLKVCLSKMLWGRGARVVVSKLEVFPIFVTESGRERYT